MMECKLPAEYDIFLKYDKFCLKQYKIILVERDVWFDKWSLFEPHIPRTRISHSIGSFMKMFERQTINCIV